MTAIAPSGDSTLASPQKRRTRKDRSANFYRRYQRIEPWLYVGPALIVTAVLVLAPIQYLVQASLRRLELGDRLSDGPFVGLDNYRTAVSGASGLGDALRLSLLFTVVALIVEIVLGLMIALLIERLERALPVLLAVMLVPMVLMPAMVAMIWRLYFSYEGLFNWGIGLAGINPVNWASREHALKAVIITDVWQWTPFFVLLFVAGLQNVPREIKEAAEVDGAGPFQVLRLIKLPILMPLMIIAATLRVMELLRNFDLAFVMFGGGPGNATETLPLAIYRTTVQRLNVGVGSVLSIGLIVVVMSISWIFIGLMKKYRVDS